ncbi:MAG: hypothetical protein RJA34_1435, partial [Pseudomonadota bacterium]
MHAVDPELEVQMRASSPASGAYSTYMGA